MKRTLESHPADCPTPVSFAEAFWTWCRVAALSFGGPAGQIAVMHRILVEEKKWIAEDRFLHALNFCMLLPGPEAQQLATYIGFLMHRTPDALMAGGLFILPGFFSILVLSIIYALGEETILVQAIFFGLKPAVMAIVFHAVARMSRRILKNNIMVSLAVASFLAMFFFDVPFPALIITAGFIGWFGGIVAPTRFHVMQGHVVTPASSESLLETVNHPADVGGIGPNVRRSMTISVVCLTLWFAPIAILSMTLGEDSVYFREATFFSKAAVVTFGGAYSVLAYVAQQAVENYEWLRPGEMLDGLGLAETTPGPLIMVVQFVGFLGAYRNPGPFSPLVGGILGSLLTTWVTFVPCFFWILLGAPYVERLRNHSKFHSALSAITAVVVGVIFNLAVWFSLHTLFGQVTTHRFWLLRLQVPVWFSVNIAEFAIAVLASLITFYWKKGVVMTLCVSTAAGIAWYIF